MDTKSLFHSSSWNNKVIIETDAFVLFVFFDKKSKSERKKNERNENLHLHVEAVCCRTCWWRCHLSPVRGNIRRTFRGYWNTIKCMVKLWKTRFFVECVESTWGRLLRTVEALVNGIKFDLSHASSTHLEDHHFYNLQRYYFNIHVYFLIERWHIRFE